MAERMDWKQNALYRLMSDISEECYCAGWMHGKVSDEQIAELRAIAAEVGGWIRWHDDEDEPDLDASEWGPRFEPLTEWQRRYDKHMADHAALREKFAPALPRLDEPQDPKA